VLGVDGIASFMLGSIPYTLYIYILIPLPLAWGPRGTGRAGLRVGGVRVSIPCAAGRGPC
jgi:hypothetical protein